MLRALLILAIVVQPLLAWGAAVRPAMQPAPPVACCPLCEAAGPGACSCGCAEAPDAPETPREPRAPAPDRAGATLLAWMARPTGVVVWEALPPLPRPAASTEVRHPLTGDRPQPFLCVWTT